MNKLRPLSLSELTPMTFDIGLTHLGLEASKYDTLPGGSTQATSARFPHSNFDEKLNGPIVTSILFQICYHKL